MARFHWAGCREAQQPLRWDRAELLDYNNALPFSQNWSGRCLARISRSRALPLANGHLPVVASHLSRILFTKGNRVRTAAHDRQPAAIYAEPVRDLTMVADVKHRQVGVFARLDAPLAVG